MLLDFSGSEFVSDVKAEDLPEGSVRTLLSLWESRRAGRVMPERKDFNPSEMVGLLPDLCLMDIEAGSGRLRVRLFGTRLVAMSGIDLTGHYIDEVKGGRGVIERCDVLIRRKAPIYRRNIPLKWSPRTYRSYDVLALPLSSNGVDVTMILFLLEFN
ncbi:MULTISPECIES: PAS domain-containing protein [unclassified Iodidimonas]|uniref:PAS domain-containing protein n=1 Tax=unclassified Iodidimonas TaxID=2626145 RepID=UPI0024822FCE|nr:MULTISPECIES: PAS domain-containing protein [unclassified Iodidimonas]